MFVKPSTAVFGGCYLYFDHFGCQFLQWLNVADIRAAKLLHLFFEPGVLFEAGHWMLWPVV